MEQVLFAEFLAELVGGHVVVRDGDVRSEFSIENALERRFHEGGLQVDDFDVVREEAFDQVLGFGLVVRVEFDEEDSEGFHVESFCWCFAMATFAEVSLFVNPTSLF